MGSTMTLRGGFDVNIGKNTSYGASTEHQIFAYESMDRTRAWRITYASVWIQETLHGTGGGDSRALLQCSLSTDTLGPVTITSGATGREWQRRMGAADNPRPQCSQLNRAELERSLPPETPRIDARGRQEQIAGRRAGVRKRFKY